MRTQQTRGRNKLSWMKMWNPADAGKRSVPTIDARCIFKRRRRCGGLAATSICLLFLAGSPGRGTEVRLRPAAATTPDAWRWLDAAGNAYAASYRKHYSYDQADVRLYFDAAAPVFRVRIVGVNLKPNFAYQVKIEGIPGTTSGEQIGLTGRWWQEEWDGSDWAWGWNLNDKGDGSFPNPNDEAYFARKDAVDPTGTSPTDLRYRFTPYLLFGYFITDGSGAVDAEFTINNSYHVLWLTSQRTHTDDDGPVAQAEVAPSALSSAYDVDGPLEMVALFGEWERLPHNGVFLPPGHYTARFLLTEESFHGLGGEWAGFWATALEAPIEFTIGTPPSITRQPRDAIVAVGGRAVMSVEADGAPNPSFTWMHGGEVAAENAGPTLVIDPVSIEDAGEYTCVVANLLGSVQSRTARLAVLTRDDDVDELDDAWEGDCFGDLTHSPDADDDGDGFSNRAEFLRGTDGSRYLLVLHPGWNNISVARVPDDNSVENVLRPATGVLSGPVWEWTGQCYEPAMEICPLRGYWVYCTADADVAVELSWQSPEAGER